MSNTRMDGAFARLLKPQKVKDLDRAWAAVAGLVPKITAMTTIKECEQIEALQKALRAIEALGGRDTTGGEP